jgi:hypothetical protein
MAHAALISPMWLNACGKFPIISPLAGRIGRIDVVWVAHLSITVGLSADAIVEMEAAFDEMEPELRAQAAGQLCGRGRTGSGPPFTGSPPDGAMGSRCSKPRPGPGIRRMRTVTPRSVRIIQIFPERSVVSPARPGSTVEVLLGGSGVTSRETRRGVTLDHGG